MTNLTRFGLALLLAAIQSAPAMIFAQAASPSIAECAAMDADVERLACYDRVSGRAPAAPPAPDQPPISVPVGKRPSTGSLIDTAWDRAGVRPLRPESLQPELLSAGALH